MLNVGDRAGRPAGSLIRRRQSSSMVALRVLDMTYSSCIGASDLFFFFFSSRRRHTRLQGDWSSDVCSSDLQLLHLLLPQRPRHNLLHLLRDGELLLGTYLFLLAL